LRDDFAANSEFHHGLRIANSNHVFVSGLTIRDCPGDGIYVGGLLNTNVTIKNVTCHNNNRDGITAANVNGLLIEDATLTNNHGTSPESGLECEPLEVTDTIANCVFRRVHTSGNARGGFYLQLVRLTNESTDIGVLMEDCDSTGDSSGATGPRPAWYCNIKNTTPAGGSIVVNRLTVNNSVIRSIGVRGKPADGPTVEFHNCTINNPGGLVTQKPIWLESGAGDTAPVAGIVFDDINVNDSLDRYPMQFYDGANPDVQVYNISGEVTVTYNGISTVNTLNQTLLITWLDADYLDVPPA